MKRDGEDLQLAAHSAALACCCLSLMCMLSSQSDVASPASPALLISQPRTVSVILTLFIRPRSWCQQVIACQSVVTAAQQRQCPSQMLRCFCMHVWALEGLSSGTERHSPQRFAHAWHLICPDLVF